MSKVLKALSLLMLCFMITACGTNGVKVTDGTSASTNGTESETNTVNNEKLIVYTNSHSAGRGEWWTEKAKEAGFKIEIVGAGGGDVTNRLLAEKNNPIADVVFGLNNMFYESLKKENVLIPYTPSWASQVEEGLNDPEGYYHGLVKQAILLGYNIDYYTPETAPKDWTDLYTNEAFKGLYEAPTRLDKATPRLVVSGILMPFKDENGDLGISEEGWNAVKLLYKNGVRAIEGEELYVNMASGKTPIGTLVSGERAKKEEEFNVKTGFVSPENGVPMVVEHIAIVNGTKKEDTVKKFIEWFGSANMQGQFAAEFNAMPVIAEAAEHSSDEVKEMYSTLKAQQLEWGFLADNLDAWVEKIELQIME